jgi:hypothetical protein
MDHFKHAVGCKASEHKKMTKHESSNDEKIRKDEAVRELLFVIRALSLIRHSSFGFVIFSSPALAGIAYRRQAFAKFRLLTFGVFLLLRLPCLLLRAGTGSTTAGYCNNKCWNEKHSGNHFFH